MSAYLNVAHGAVNISAAVSGAIRNDLKDRYPHASQESAMVLSIYRAQKSASIGFIFKL